jgi:hypothetical protein
MPIISRSDRLHLAPDRGRQVQEVAPDTLHIMGGAVHIDLNARAPEVPRND